MQFKEIQFKEANAQRVYSNYINSIKNVVKPLTVEDQQEVLMEFNSHIYENIQKNTAQGELDSLLNAIDKLGNPEIVLKPLIADKLLDKATRTFNPLHVFNALIRNIGNGISYIIFFLLYTFLGSFIFLIFAKLFNNKVGLFYQDGKPLALGLIEESDQYQEVLGHWFIPAMLVALVVLYLILTLCLKLKKILNKK